MGNEPADQNDTAVEGTTNGANGHHPEATVEPRPASERPAVRYMDDATFRRCLEKVVNVHDRLLAELAK